MFLLLLLALLPGSALWQGSADEIGVVGYVLGPDGMPVSSGTVVIQSTNVPATTPIEPTGRFRFVPARSGPLRVTVSVAGLAPYTFRLTVPASRAIRLPVIRLDPATYFRVRFVTPEGETITTPQLRRRSFDANGALIDDIPGGDGVSQQIDGTGATIIGPLPRGITALALDMPFYAQTRLPNVVVNGADALIDGGTVAVQPGAVLQIDLVDETGAAVPDLPISLEDTRPLSPLPITQLRTNQQGRATFEPLAAGRYLVRAAALGKCNGRDLFIARTVAVPAEGTHETRFVVSGTATFRISSPALGALKGIPVSAMPDMPRPPLPGPLRGPVGPSLLLRILTITPCRGATDRDGRVRLASFPPGPTDLAVQFGNSTYVRRLEVPVGGHEIAISIPDGFLPVRVSNAANTQPVPRALVTWTVEGGGRVEATTSANGDVLLEGVGIRPGVLTISAPGFRSVEEPLPEPPGILHEVALVPLPVTTLKARIVAASGEPLPDAVVELSAMNKIAAPQVAVTDAKGVVAFNDVPAGTLHVMAGADVFVARTIPIAEDRRADVTLALSRGYRIVANVELPAGTGPLRVRVLNNAGETLENALDSASDRRIKSPGRLTLGPLTAGRYVIELSGAQERRTPIEIVDRDVAVTIR
ncbi:MAG: hypothetical protein AUF76_09905 [Acidobacteria bacterium 13_1_20CM_2_65_9]|nr:MAG: hypothetical protein AUF76_09905 [Acidobacteria bacterium 13_1_20CM_2_65_9]